MINVKKFENAMYAMQGLLVKARDMAYKNEDNEKLARLLDYLEYLPKLVATPEDKTDVFTSVICEIVEVFELNYIGERYNNKIPEVW
jgi:hypothetical protein